MSYTNKKVTWEKCNDGSDTEVYLEDADGKILIDKDSKYLLAQMSGAVNEYGDSIMDEYNDIYRPTIMDVIVRKQPHEEVIKTTDGKEILTKSYFYVNPKIEPHALDIKYMDKLDGETVMQKYIMCDLSNKPKMVRYITV